MLYVRIAIALLLIAAGLWLSILNWGVFYRGYILRKNAPSWVPLVGGMLMFFGMFALDQPALRPYLWLPFVVDYGCAPAFVVMFLYLIWCGVKAISGSSRAGKGQPAPDDGSSSAAE